MRGGMGAHVVIRGGDIISPPRFESITMLGPSFEHILQYTSSIPLGVRPPCQGRSPRSAGKAPLFSLFRARARASRLRSRPSCRPSPACSPRSRRPSPPCTQRGSVSVSISRRRRLKSGAVRDAVPCGLVMGGRSFASSGSVRVLGFRLARAARSARLMRRPRMVRC